MAATALQSFLVDQLVGGGRGWGRSGVDLAFVLRELGIEPAETPASGDA